MTRLLLFRALTLAVVSVGVALPGHAQTLDTVSPQTYDPPAHVSFVEGRRHARARRLAGRGAAEHAARRRRSRADPERPRRDSLRRRIDAASRREHGGRLPVRRADSAARGADPPLDSRARSGDVYYRVDAAAGWAQITAPGEYRLSLRGDARSPELELAVLRVRRPRWLTKAGQTPLRAGERAFVRAGAAPSYAYVFNSASWDASTSGRSRAARSARTCRRSTCRAKCSGTPLTSITTATGGRTPTYGHVWYPTRRARLAAVLPRPLGDAAGVWLDLGRPRSLGLADASLRPLGHSRRARGSGSRGGAGRRRGSPGPTRPAT
jgi:hypothetical protein